MNRTCLNPWALGTFIVGGALLSPIIAVFAAATGDGSGLWGHLFDTVLPRYVGNTLLLMLGVGFITLIFGISSAWVIVRYNFLGRKVIEWCLLLPFAVPPYIAAYAYTDFFEYSGPLQGMLREVFQWENARSYWFPEIRSLPGAMLVMGSVLYPYVYVMSRVAFTLTPASLFEAGMLTQRNVFSRIGLPLARPAIISGLALVLMETISDFGTVEYFSIETLTLGIFNVWLGMNSLPTAAQIASLSFVFVVLLLTIEMISRSRRKFADTTRSTPPLKRVKLNRNSTYLCWFICLVPIFLGFIIPAGILIDFAIDSFYLTTLGDIGSAAKNSLFISGASSIVVIVVASLLGFVTFYQKNSLLKKWIILASTGYAFPGTILAIGVVTIGGALDNGISSVLHKNLGVSHHGWFTGGVGLVIFACVVRFQAIGYGAITSGLERLPVNMLDASRVLGKSFSSSLYKIIFPLSRLSIISGALLVFVDTMKELPMALLLRPFNYETLATFVYQYAKDELIEEAAFPALIIIITSIIPVIIINYSLNRVSRNSYDIQG